MTKRKQPGSTFESWVEQQIREAQAEGQFDDLPGAGKPLPDLDEVHDPAWWVKKLVRRERISILPPALSIKREVERVLERIKGMKREGQVRTAVEEVNVRIKKVNSTTAEGPATSTSPLHAEEVVRRWRENSL